MQAFTLRQDERLRIGGDIVVLVQRIRGGSVRLGFLVPQHVAVDREEVAEFKHRVDVERNLSGATQDKPPSSDHTKGP